MFNTPGFLSLINFQENPPSVSNGEGWGGFEDTLQSRQDQVSIFGNGRLISVNSAWLLDLVRTSRVSYVCQWRFKKNLKDLQDNYFALRDRNQEAESRVLVWISNSSLILQFPEAPE